MSRQLEENKRYIAILKTGFTLKLEFEEYDNDKRIAEYIGCDWIDHTSVFDDLENENIDVWVDDEGLLNRRPPAFIFFDEEDNMTGALVGNIGFLKHDDSGYSFGLNKEECESLERWLFNLHDSDKYLHSDDGRIYQAFSVRPFETVDHRRRIQDAEEFVKSIGGEVIHV